MLGQQKNTACACTALKVNVFSVVLKPDASICDITCLSVKQQKWKNTLPYTR